MPHSIFHSVPASLAGTFVYCRFLDSCSLILFFIHETLITVFAIAISQQPPFNELSTV